MVLCPWNNAVKLRMLIENYGSEIGAIYYSVMHDIPETVISILLLLTRLLWAIFAGIRLIFINYVPKW